MRRGRVFILFPAHGNLPDSPGLFFTGIILLISCPGTTAQNHMPEQDTVSGEHEGLCLWEH
ncbi:hypothetical protein BvCmsNSNP012_01997 [Escherichia coli]|nr:hypothetical protein BvCmsNSNP012_01997 [Escherichia coli]